MIGILRKISYNKSMMDFIKPLSLVALLPFMLTCQPLNSSSGFNVTLASNQVTMIAATTSSCAGINSGVPDANIAATYFQLPSMTVSWTNSAPLTIEWVEFTITSPDVNNGTQFTCMIAGTDLLNAWIQNWNAVNPTTGSPVCSTVTTIPQTVTLTSSSPASPTCDVAALTSSCPFNCGGITMTNPHQTSAGAIQVKIYAVYTSGSSQVPLISTQTLTYQYEGI